MNDEYMDIKDYTETVSVRFTKAQVERLREIADATGQSQSDLIRYWVDNADLLPHIPQGVCEKLRKIAGGRRGQTAGKLIEGVLRREWFRWGWK